MTLPRRLSVSPVSPHFDPKAALRVDKVFVNDVLVQNCIAYDMDAGWAFTMIKGVWQPKLYGVVRVTERQGFAKPAKA